MLVVFAAQHYASQLVLANSQRTSSRLPRSHQDKARKAFERITRTLLPASHKALARALDAEARSYRKQVDALDTGGPKQPPVAAAPAVTHDVDAAAAVAEDELDEDLEHSDAGDIDDVDEDLDGDDAGD